MQDAKNEQQVAQIVAEYVKDLAPGKWVLGGYWNHYNWGGMLPNKTWIDDVTPKNPAMLKRMDGHMV